MTDRLRYRRDRHAQILPDSLNASKDAWVNRQVLASPSSASPSGAPSYSTTSSTLTASTSIASLSQYAQPSSSWKLTRATVKNGSLVLFKPPPDLSIQSFDAQMLPPNASPPQTLRHQPSSNLHPVASSASSQTAISHKRIVSMSLPPKAANLSKPTLSSLPAATSVSYRGLDAHPELIYDAQGTIIDGSLEAICHTVVLGDDDEFVVPAVLTIPLLGDMVTALEYMKEYVSTARPVGHMVSPTSPDIVAKRIQLTINTILANFKGMMLDGGINLALQQLADSVSSYDDQISTTLKVSVYQEHQRMNKLLVYSKENSEILWSMQHKVTEPMSEKLQSFLARIDSKFVAAATNPSELRQITLPPDLFIELANIDVLASQISCFHLKFYKSWAPANDISLLYATGYKYQRYNPLLFDNNHPHFLGALVIEHLLSDRYAKIDDAYRGRLLTAWIKLGNALKSEGDLVGWIAIVTAVCSPPILRLRNSWAHVATDLRETVGKDWGRELFELDRRAKMDLMSKRTFRVSTEDIGVAYPKERSISFFADLVVKPHPNSTYKQCEDRVNRIRTVISSWKYFFDRIAQNDTFGPPPQQNASIQKLLHCLLMNNYENDALSTDAVMRMSLAAEPPTLGAYLKHYYSQQSPLLSGAYMPLLFTDVNPVYRLFPKFSVLGAMNPTPVRETTYKRTLKPMIGGRGMYGGVTVTTASSTTLTSSTSMRNSSLSSTAHLHRSNSFPPSSSQIVAMTTGVQDIDLSGREFVSRYSSSHVLLKNVRDVLNMGASLYHINDDIVVKSLADDHTSRPSSVIETASKNLTAARLASEKLSNGSPRTSVTEFDHPVINVVVKSANVERLVDILVLGINGFASFVSPQDLSKPGVPEFRIDMNVHTLTFFATYRSFCSPLELLSSLRKRFMGSKAAAVSISEQMEENGLTRPDDSFHFPNWDPVCDVELDNDVAWGIVAQIQIGVMEACHLWVSQYFGDFADDMILKEQFVDLVDVWGSEISRAKEMQASEVNADYMSHLETMEALYKKVRNLFYKKSYRPNDVRLLISPTPVGMRFDNLPLGFSTLSNQKIEKLVDDINTIAMEYFSMITAKEWLEVFELLEVQSAQFLRFFQSAQSPYTTDDDVVVQDIFSYIETMHGDSSDARFFDSLPRPVQELFRIRNVIIRYLTYQIGDPLIHKDDRASRMMTIMRMLGVAKARMGYLDLFPQNSAESDDSGPEDSSISTHVPAFLESCIVQAVVRPESRMFANSWIQAGRNLANVYNRSVPQNFATLDVFVPVIDPDQLVYDGSHRPLTPCVGWMIERMLEIVCCVPNMSVENSSLINFDKRRYVYNLITNIGDLRTGGDPELDSARIQQLKKKLAYLINPEETLYFIDKKTLRETAVKDMKEYPKAYAKNRVFVSYLLMEVEKLKRDIRQKDVLEKAEKESRKGQIRSRAPDGSSTGAPSTIGERRAPRSRFGGLLKAVRPISMAFSSNFVPTADRIVSVSELPDMSTINDSRCKQISSVNLASCEVSFLAGQQVGGAFKVTLPDGNEVILQATSEGEGVEWVRVIGLAKRFALAKSQPAGTFTKVFGVPIGTVCEREDRQIPKVVEVLLAEIEERGLDEVGLYRVSGSLASVNALRAAFDSGEEVNMKDDRFFDINTVAGCFKLYLRELSEPLLTTELFPSFARCGEMEGDEALKHLQQCIARLPTPNYNLLRRLLDHLGRVADHEANNKMKTPNLAIVFSMSFLPSSAVDQMKAMQNVVNTMIINHAKLFSDVPIIENTTVHMNHRSEDTEDGPEAPVYKAPAAAGSANRDSFTEVSAY